MPDDTEFSLSIVPAAPGFRLYELNEDAPRLLKPGFTIIAWAVQHRQLETTAPDLAGDIDSNATPITSHGARIVGEYVIEQPDGSMVFEDGTVEASFVDAQDRLGDLN